MANKKKSVLFKNAYGENRGNKTLTRTGQTWETYSGYVQPASFINLVSRNVNFY